MSIHVLPGDIRFEPPLPVEIPVSVDGKTLRVAIEWPAVARMLPTADKSFDAVATALRGKRATIEMAIRAHLFAQGTPLDGHVRISAADIDAVSRR